MSYHLCWVLPVVVVLTASAVPMSPVERLRDQLFDFYQRLDPRPFDAEAAVNVIDIDDASIARLGQWPWPRTRLAELVDRLHASGAAAIGFDIVFSEADRTSADAFLAALPDSAKREAIRVALGSMEDNDHRFAGAVSEAPAVLGVVANQAGSRESFAAPFGIATSGGDPKPDLVAFPAALLPLPGLLAKANGLGVLNWLPDRDQVVRRVPLFLAVGTRIVPSLALECLRLAQGATSYVIRSDPGAGGIDAVRVGAIVLASGATGDYRPRFSLHRRERFVPAWQVLQGTAPALDGRIVIVGSSSAGLADIRATAVDPAMPGVEIQAQTIETMLDGNALMRPPVSRIEAGAGVAATLVMAVALPFVPVLAGALVLATAISSCAAASWWLFCQHRLLIDPLVPAACLLAGYVGAMSALFRAEQRDRQFVQTAFGRFVSPAVVARLAREPDRLALGGELRELTVMFTDVRQFSTIAEGMSAPELARFMNRYLSPMSAIVLAHQGTIDKYIGDAIMAFWNAPLVDDDHAAHATSAALAMLAALPDLRNSLTPAGSSMPTLRCGIGLATGPCVIGNLGSDLRFDYSALGDDVNIASRLESLTKTYGVDVLATDAVRERAPGFAWLAIDEVVVVGRGAPTRLSTPVGGSAMAASEEFGTLRFAHDAMLVAYRSADFVAAEEAARRLAEGAPASIAEYYRLMEERCRKLAQQPPTDWDGVTRLERK